MVMEIVNDVDDDDDQVISNHQQIINDSFS